MDSLVKILMYIARALVILVGGGVGLIKIVKGKSDDNPKEFNEGIAIIAAAGILFGATFAIEAMFTV